MTDRAPQDPQRDPDDQAEKTDAVPSAIGESLARAAQKSGLGQLADGETPTGAALLGALGGVRGLAETILPGLVFLVLYTFTQNVPLSIGCSVLVAVVFTIVRIVGKTPVTQAIAGLLGVGISAILALITGRGEDNFILGIWTNAAYGAAILISMLVRWPLIGLAAGYLMGDGLAWRRVRSTFRVMQALTFFWFLLFAARLIVQVPLYLAHTDQATIALGITKLLMGVPLYAPLLLITWFVVRGQFDTDKKPARG
ncbi:DUF3159 domain-containing protein [Leifsonia poae]|uniref:DUF3159 domain-containing protein n=1 Tax=Leifsonia poae TaxID=110933 RepID=UPI001CC02398|nr:DUF3159 domain-containing protein [Leifsonia poae]